MAIRGRSRIHAIYHLAGRADALSNLNFLPRFHRGTRLTSAGMANSSLRRVNADMPMQ